MKTPEGYEKADVIKYLKSIGAYYFCPVQTGYGQQTVDIIACINGVFWGLEIKREGKLQTKRQLEHANNIMKAGGHIAWGTANKVIAKIGWTASTLY